jgi:probable F420-dependent oxidoreductase
VTDRGTAGALRFGAVFPTNEIGSDPEYLRRFAAAAVEAGLDYLVIFDHVVGADIAERPDWRGAYTVDHEFHEPFTLLAYLAACCPLELMTGVLVLPQRQAVLVAKQAAELDLLTRGRFILGVGTGWNDLEYRALNVDFAARGRRFDEQLEVMRQLWTQRVVTFRGSYHDLDRVGIAPLPMQRPIPVWMGANPVGPGLRRIARSGDGWISMHPPGPDIRDAFARLREMAAACGRDPGAIGLQGLMQWRGRRVGEDEELQAVQNWLECGARRISFSGARAGRTPDEHVRYIADKAAIVARYR